jgi:DNA-binding HxlR family transcriptional regulator
MKNPHLHPMCPGFKAALDILGRPWTGLILTLLQDGPLRFCELSERTQGLGDKTLSARLKELEARGLVVRRVHPEPPIRVEYALTRKGQGFRAVQEAIEGWARQLGAPDVEAERETEKKPVRRVVPARVAAKKG